MQVINLALFIVATVLLFYGSWRVAIALRMRGAIERAVTTVMLSLMGIVLVSLLMGWALRQYKPIPLAIGAAALSMAALWWARKRRALSAQTRAEAKGSVGRVLKGLFRHPVVLAAVLLAGVAYGWEATLGVAFPTFDWDTNMYHYVGPDLWIQEGSIDPTPMNSDLHIWINVYPLNVELIQAWPGVFLHSMQYASLGQLPMFALGALSVAGMARRMGARRAHAALAGVLYLVLPAVVVQASTGYIDVSSAGLALAAIYLATGLTAAIRAEGEMFGPIVRYMTLTGLATALAIGAKSPNLVLVPIILVTLVISLYQVWDEGNRPWRVTAEDNAVTDPETAPPVEARVGKHEKARRKAAERRVKWAANPDRITLATIGAFLAPMLLVGSFWYLRTWIAYDNPFYPFRMFGFEGTGSVYDVIIKNNIPEELNDRPWGVFGQVAWSWIQDLDVGRVINYDERIGGYGLTWLLVILPAALFAIVRYVRGNRVGPLPVYLALAIVVFATSPAAWWARYTLIIPAVAYALGAVALSAMPNRLAPATVQAAVIGLTGISLWGAVNPTPILDQPSHRATVAQAVKMLNDPEKKQQIWPWDAMEPLTKLPKGATIGVVDDYRQPFPHAFAGMGLERNVKFLDRPKSMKEFRADLESEGVDYVVIHPTGKSADIAVDAKFNKQLFELVSYDATDLYGAYLLKVVDRPDVCKTAGVHLQLEERSQDEGKITMKAKATDDCGDPLKNMPLTLNEQNVVSQTFGKLDEGKTNSDGEIEFSVKRKENEESDQRFFFVRFQGNLNQDAGASTPIVVIKK